MLFKDWLTFTRAERAQIAAMMYPEPRDTRIVTFGDWVRATGYRGYAPGECVKYDPRDGLPTYR